MDRPLVSFTGLAANPASTLQSKGSSYGQLSVTQDNQLIVRVADAAGVDTDQRYTSREQFAFTSGDAYSVKDRPCQVPMVWGFLAETGVTGSLYVQFFDRNDPLSGGDVPDRVWPVAQDHGTFYLAVGLRFAAGCQIGLSSTVGTYTPAGVTLYVYGEVLSS